jgi:hypothetical protein
MKKLKLILIMIRMMIISIVKIVISKVLKVKKTILMENNFKNQQLQKHCQGKGRYRNTVIILVDITRRRSRYGTYYMVMSLPTVTQVIKATLMEPRSYRQKGNWALGIINACSGNPLIVILPATIIAYLAHLTLFNTAQSNMAFRTVGNRKIRDDAWIVVQHDLKALMAVAQANSDANTLNGITIIQSGLFKVKMVPGKQNKVFRADVNTGISGTIILNAPEIPRTSLHIWEQSLDGITWTPIDKSRKGTYTVTGLKPVSKMWFRHGTDPATALGWDYIYVTIP